MSNTGMTFDVMDLEHSMAFVRAAGLVVDAVTTTTMRGHIDVTAEHHTPWGIVHGGVYATAIESAASIGATTAVQDRGQVAVGLTNTTHFLRSIKEGRVEVNAVAGEEKFRVRRAPFDAHAAVNTTAAITMVDRIRFMR